MRQVIMFPQISWRLYDHYQKLMSSCMCAEENYTVMAFWRSLMKSFSLLLLSHYHWTLQPYRAAIELETSNSDNTVGTDKNNPWFCEHNRDQDKKKKKGLKYVKYETELWCCTRMQPSGCTSRIFNTLTYLSFAITPTPQLEINQSEARCKQLVLRWRSQPGTKVQSYCAERLCCTNALDLKALQLQSD